MPRFLLIRLTLYNIINTNLKFDGITSVGAVSKLIIIFIVFLLSYINYELDAQIIVY